MTGTPKLGVRVASRRMLPDTVVASPEMLPMSVCHHVAFQLGRRMDRKMTHTVRTELADAIRLRYRSATGKQKHKILDEFVASTGYHEKSAIRVLNGHAGSEGPPDAQSPIALR